MTRSSSGDPLLPVVDAGRVASTFIPGGVGKAVGAGIEVVGGEMEADSQVRDLRKAGMNLYQARHYSRSARDYLKKLDGKSMSNLGAFGVQIAGGSAGAVVGGIVGSFIGMPWLGGLVGGFGGGFIAGHVHSSITKTEQDGVNLAKEIYYDIKARKPITREKALAQMLAVLPEAKQEKYEDKLDRKTGTRRFDEALETGEGKRALRKMRYDSEMQKKLSRYFPVSPDEYAALINSGRLDPRAIILDPSSIAPIADRWRREQVVNAPNSGDIITTQRQLPAMQPSADKNLAVF